MHATNTKGIIVMWVWFPIFLRSSYQFGWTRRDKRGGRGGRRERIIHISLNGLVDKLYREEAKHLDKERC